VPEPAPIVAYVESEQSLFEPAIPPGVVWSDVLGEVERITTAVIARDGAFVVHSEVGVLLLRAA
jgi:hypothetical protein